MTTTSSRTLLLPVAILCIAMNDGLGTLVNLLKLPVYLDAAGTLAFALIFTRSGCTGFVWAAAVGAPPGAGPSRSNMRRASRRG